MKTILGMSEDAFVELYAYKKKALFIGAFVVLCLQLAVFFCIGRPLKVPGILFCSVLGAVYFCYMLYSFIMKLNVMKLLYLRYDEGQTEWYEGRVTGLSESIHQQNDLWCHKLTLVMEEGSKELYLAKAGALRVSEGEQVRLCVKRSLIIGKEDSHEI